jgi:serine phosphatase RsbU (regulator of sigma subunit)
MFTTLCMITIAPDRDSVSIRLAGHPPPLLVSDGGGIESLEASETDPPLGVVVDAQWTARDYKLPGKWALLLYTDGLIEGRTGVGEGRLGGEGLAAMVRGTLDTLGEDSPGLVTSLVERAEELNGGPMLDDVAAFLVQRR